MEWWMDGTNGGAAEDDHRSASRLKTMNHCRRKRAGFNKQERDWSVADHASGGRGGHQRRRSSLPPSTSAPAP